MLSDPALGPRAASGVAHLSDDWERMYGHPAYFAETFIGPGPFRGTCYRAANWQLFELTNQARQERPDEQPGPPDQRSPRLALDTAVPRAPQPVMTMRQRIEVNLDELDQIIDRSTRAPLSESDGQKLRTALHAMAEKLVRKRSTEKTNSVLSQDAVPVDKPSKAEIARRPHIGRILPTYSSEK